MYTHTHTRIHVGIHGGMCIMLFCDRQTEICSRTFASAKGEFVRVICTNRRPGEGNSGGHGYEKKVVCFLKGFGKKNEMKRERKTHVPAAAVTSSIYSYGSDVRRVWCGGRVVFFFCHFFPTLGLTTVAFTYTRPEKTNSLPESRRRACFTNITQTRTQRTRFSCVLQVMSIEY